MNATKCSSLSDVIGEMGLPAACLDEIAPINYPDFHRRVGQLIAAAMDRPPPRPRRPAGRAAATRLSDEFD